MKARGYFFGALMGSAVMLALFGACSNPSLPDSMPTGTGAVTVSFAVEGAGEANALRNATSVRTVFPLLSGFTKYDLSFSPVSGGEAHEPVEVSGGSATVNLAAGTYTVTATGYTGTSTAAAFGTAANVVVTEGATTPVSIILSPKTDAEGTGSFGYDITVPAGVTSAQLVITTQDGAAVAGGTVNLTAGQGNTGTVSLPPGYYKIKVELVKEDEHAGFTNEAVHIYSGLTSGLEPKVYTAASFSSEPLPGDETGSLQISIGFGDSAIPLNQSGGITLVKDGTSVTLSVPDDEGYTGVAWYVDGDSTAAGTGYSITLDPAAYNVREHTLTVTATKNAKPYSETVEFTVLAEAPASGPLGSVLILQAYGTYNKTDGAGSHCFVELYNISNDAIDLSGSSIQYAGPSASSWTVINLSGSIPAHASYLIRGWAGNSGARLNLTSVTPDVSDTSFRPSNDGWKIALMSNQTALAVHNPFDIGGGAKSAGYVDMVTAYNNDSSYSGTGHETAPNDGISKQKSARRKNLIDTDNNSVDFRGIDYRTSGTSAAQLEQYRPRTAADGAYSPQF
ncbi:MAG: lamin tail domain-containing protein [Treponema sp.]|jgi:hypothetical protein|nr:lamin tail domain-containing protein [Treponema sp.]